MSGADAPTEPADAAWHGDAGVAIGSRMGRYELVGVLGVGGMGIVFEARDPELDRAVAVKVLRRSGTAATGEAQLRREGQTMARLSHPNVCRIYDVGVAHGHLFVAMEYIAGGTLAGWLADGEHGPDAIIARFVDAGRGLAAAHDAGLVHRDFKPTNVLVARDGRVLVTDFGLARSAGVAASADATRGAAAAAAGATTGPTVSVTGRIVGTPAYMAPEQHAGGAVDARADQYSFCISLWRALFEPETSTVPVRVRRALERGLDPSPARRFPSMPALLTELAPPRRRTGIAITALAGASLAIGATIVALSPSADRDPCPAPNARASAVWGPARRAAVRAQLVAIDPAAGAARFEAAAATLDLGIPAWRDMHVAACRATRVEATESDEVLDSRMRCLDGWLASVEQAVIGATSATDPHALEAAIKPTVAPPLLARCADPKALAAEAQLPAAPAARDEALAILADVEAMRVELKASRMTGLIARTEAVTARARRLGNAAVLAKALGVETDAVLVTGDRVRPSELLRELAVVAAAGKADHLATQAWIMLSRITSIRGKFDEAQVVLVAAHAALASAGEPPDLVAALLTAEAEIDNNAHDPDAALAKLTEARAVLDANGADQPGSPLFEQLIRVLITFGDAYYYASRLDEAVAAYRASLALIDRRYGPDTRERAAVDFDLAQVLRDQEKYAEAEATLRESIELSTALAGDSAVVAGGLGALAEIIASDETRLDEAIAMAERARAMGRATMADGDLERDRLELLVANLLDDSDRGQEALAIFATVVPAIEKAGLESADLPIIYLMWADLERRLEHYDDAIVHYQRTAEVGRAMSPKNLEIGMALRGEAECLYQQRKYADAIARLEAAGRLPVPESAEEDVGFGKALLGMLLADTGRDRARGVAMVREAIADFATTDLDAEDPRHARITAWAARHGIRRHVRGREIP